MNKAAHREDDARLLNFLLQLVEYGAVKEFPQADVHAVTNLLDRHDPRILALGVENAVDRCWRNARIIGQRVHSDAAALAQFQNSLGYGLFSFP